MDTAVTEFAGHRAVFEQAKGVLGQLYSVDADTAFAVLNAYSMDANRKLRDVADMLVVAASRDLKGRPSSAHDLLEQLRADSRGERDDATPTG